MALLDDLKLDAPDAAPDEIEKRMSSGGLPPEGLHHAVLDGCRPFTANSGTKGYEFTFLIIAGPANGVAFKSSIFQPKGEDAEKDKKATDKLRLYAHRLGLLKKVAGENGKSKYVPVEGKTDFIHCMGTEVIVEVEHEDDEYTNDKGKTVKAKRARLTYEGLLPLDDKRAKDVARGKAPDRTANAAAALGGKPAARGGRDFGDM